jgi:hypothetical protein
LEGFACLMAGSFSSQSCILQESCHGDNMMAADDHHFLREDRTLLWRRVASHIAEQPGDLSIALDNCDRWLAFGRVHPAPLLEWKRLIHLAQGSPEAFRDFVSFLAAPNHDSQPIKSCSPFVGLSLDESCVPEA